MDTKLTFAQACEGFLFYRTATGKSPHTIEAYRNSFKKAQLYIPGNTPLASITREKMVNFFAWLQNDYVSEPNGIAPRGKIRLSPKSIKNIHTDLAALWAWAIEEEYVGKNIVSTVAAPRVADPVVETFTKEQIEAMLKSCSNNGNWKNGPQATYMRRTAGRDHALILVLLDTGVRASELCDMTIGNLNLNTNSIKVKGKGNKERIVQIGRRTAQVLWRYLTPRLSNANSTDPVFVVDYPADPRPFTRRHLNTTLDRIGERAGVKNVYPHRFRHTFAITYLRNGGDLLTLQSLLGHETLEMTKRYARIAGTDCVEAHRKASPVPAGNWRL